MKNVNRTSLVEGHLKFTKILISTRIVTKWNFECVISLYCILKFIILRSTTFNNATEVTVYINNFLSISYRSEKKKKNKGKQYCTNLTKPSWWCKIFAYIASLLDMLIGRKKNKINMTLLGTKTFVMSRVWKIMELQKFIVHNFFFHFYKRLDQTTRVYLYSFTLNFYKRLFPRSEFLTS